MNSFPQEERSGEQLRRLEEFGVQQCVDVHCHCLPGLDDGPEFMGESIALCEALVRDGITTVVATPHQLGRYDRENSANCIREAVSELSTALKERRVPIEVLPGGDVRLDERLPRLLDTDEIVTVADAGRHLLLELPHELFVDPTMMIAILRKRRQQAIMTHPERHRYLQGSVKLPRAWVAQGAVLQVTAGSLVGDFGRHAYDHAWRLLDAGLVHLVASDAHDTERRPPRMSDALMLLTQEVGRDVARKICLENPSRILAGEHLQTR